MDITAEANTTRIIIRGATTRTKGVAVDTVTEGAAMEGAVMEDAATARVTNTEVMDPVPILTVTVTVTVMVLGLGLILDIPHNNLKIGRNHGVSASDCG